jgi:hypothetical protein
MPPAWWDETARFVDALEATQQELLSTLRLQRRALALADSVELERLNAAAADAARRLDHLAAWRGRLLDQADGRMKLASSEMTAEMHRGDVAPRLPSAREAEGLRPLGSSRTKQASSYRSLSSILAQTVSLEAERLRGRLQAVQQRFGEVRREAWIQWVVTHRSQSFYAELLDLIAHGGQKPPVYGDGPHASPPKGGVMLDAAA